MKKFITILFSIILILCCSYIFTQKEVFSIYIDKVRGVDAEQDFSSNNTEADNDENHWYFNDLEARADLFCAQHGGCLFDKKNTIIHVNVSIAEQEVFNDDVYNGEPLAKNFSFSEVLSADKPDDNTTLSLEMTANQYAGDRFADALGIGSKAVVIRSFGLEDYIETTGISHYRKEYDITQKNTALAYILSESEFNKTYPRNSYVNIAFWQWQQDGNQASSDGIAIDKLFDGYMESTDVDEVLNKLRQEQDKLENMLAADNKTINKIKVNIKKAKQKLKNDPNNESIKKEIEEYNKNIEKIKNQKADIRNKISNKKKEITARILELLGVKNNDISTSSILTKSQNLWNEAKDFQAMWNEIKNKYNNDYKNSIKVSSNTNNISVEFDTESNAYLIGPFKMSYLERYTGEKRDANTGIVTDALQLCGITGTPRLRVSIDGKSSTLYCNEKNENGKGWTFKYALTNEERKIMWYKNYNLYPHNDEEFYIQLDYQEGLEKVEGLDFDFRWLQAEGRCVKFEGDISVIKWTAKVTDKTCPGGTKCEWGYEHEGETDHYHATSTNDCGESEVVYKCGGHTCDGQRPPAECPYHGMHYGSSGGTYKFYHNSSGTSGSSDGTYISASDSCNNKIVYYKCTGHKCKGGKKCEHGEWNSHYVGVELTVKGVVEEEEADIQDIACVPYSYRTYDSLKIGEKHDKDFTFSWDFDDIDLTTALAGEVWLDGIGQKTDATHKTDGVKDDGEKGVKNVGITVALYEDGVRKRAAIAHDSSGKRISWPIYTDSNGKYKVARLEAPGNGTYNENTKKYTTRYYAVEFTYDGQTYKSTVYLSTDGTEGTIDKYEANPNNYKKSSMAVESVNSRYAFDTKFGEIRGKDELDANLSTTGLAVKTNILGTTTNESSTNEIKYNGTQGTNPELITSKLDTPGNTNNPANNEKATGDYAVYAIKASTYYGSDNTHTINVDPANYRILYPMEGTRYVLNKWKDTGTDTKPRYVAEYMKHINLGLKQRDEVDISLQKDLYKATLVLNGQKVVKEYNRYSGDAENTEYNKFLLNVEKDSANNRYCLGLYKNDLNYQSDNYYGNAMEYIRSIKKGTELRVFVTYSIRIYNNSTTNDVEINGIKDYYDSTYTLVTADEEAPIVNSDLKLKKDIIAEAPFYRIRSTANEDMTWKPNRSELKEGYVNGDLSWTTSSNQINGMKVASTDAFKSMKISKNNFIEIFTTYEVDKEGYENMINDENANMETRVNLISDDKSNIAEVTSYSTFYTNEDLASNGYHPYKAGWISGRVDKNSAPDNIRKLDLKSRKYYENDTFRAQGLDIKVKVTERSTSGYVWEDKKSQELDKYSLSVGDGYYNSSNEKLISGVKVSLYEVINLGTFGSNGVYDGQYDGMDYYYKVPDTWYSISNGGITSGDAKVKIDGTNSSTEYDGNYAISGFLAGDYVVRFDYGVTAGDGEEENVYTYNGQDYENTRFMAELSDDSLNNKFLDITGNTKINGTGTNDLPISKARDNESRRMIVDSYSRNIENDRGEILRDRNSDEFKQNTCMYAETPIVKFDIEDPSKLEITDSEKGENLKERYERSDDTGGNSSIEYTGYTIKNMNFGLEKRAETDLELTQYIQEIELVKQNDLENPILRVYFDENGDLIKDNVDTINSNKIAYMTHKDQTVDGQGFYASSVENEYLKDLSLLVIYNVNVKNNSEVDFTGRLANLYVASDISGKASALPTENLYKQMKNSMNAEDFDNYLEEANGISGDSTLYKLLELYNNGTASDASLKKLLDGTSRLSDDQKKDDYIRPEVLVYGAYVGRYYYENNLCENEKAYTITNYSYRVDAADINLTYLADKVVKTTVDKVVDYIDVNTSSDYEYNETNYTDHTWEKVGIKKINDNNNDKYVKDFETINGLLSDDSYSDSNKNQILDEKGRELVTDNKYNIIASVNEYIQYTKQNDNKLRAEYISSDNEHISKYNERLTTGLVPEVYKNVNDKNANNIPYYSIANVSVATRKNTSSDEEANEVGLDNLVEILVYSNSTGRRDINSVPGNAMKIAKTSGFWNAGYNAYSDTNKEVENDAYAADYITIIPPTGIAMRTFIRNNILNIIGLMIALIVMSVIFGFKQFRIKRQYVKK